MLNADTIITLKHDSSQINIIKIWEMGYSFLFRSFCKQNLEPVVTYEFCNVLNAFLVFENTQNRIKYLNKIKT